MKLHKVLAVLKDYDIRKITETGIPADIQTHKLLEPGQTSFSPPVLYVGYVSDLPEQLVGAATGNLICIDDAPLPPVFLQSGNINLYLLPAGANQFDVIDKIADVMLDEATLVAAMQRILDRLYANAGLQDIVDVATEVFGNPIFIHDTAYKILAMSYRTVFQNETLEDLKQRGYIQEATIQSLKKAGLADQIHHTDEIVFNRRRDRDEEWLLKSVKLNGIAVADIALIAANRPFRDLDYDLLDRFAKIVAIEMGKSDFYKDNKGVAYNYLLADLLSERLQDQNLISQRIRILNWQVYHYFQLFVIAENKNGRMQESIPYISGQFRQLIPDCRWTVYQNKLVIFVSRPKKNVLTQSECFGVEEFMRNNHLIGGTSGAFTELTDSGRYYKQALHAVQIGKLLQRKHGIFAYADMMCYYVAHALTKEHDYRDFLHPAVSELQAYDEKNDGGLAQTLECYLAAAGDPVRTTQSLHIHRNTLLYRLNKIKELTGLDLNNGDERFKIQLHLKVLEYQKQHQHSEGNI